MLELLLTTGQNYIGNILSFVIVGIIIILLIIMTTIFFSPDNKN